LLPLAVLLLAASLARTETIDRPFAADHESAGSVFPLSVARNYLRYGPLSSRLGGVLNTGDVARANWVIYTHHPPLVPLLIAAVQGVAGVSEWSARIIPSFFSLASMAVLYLMVQRRFGRRAAFLAGIFYAFCPMTLVFGGMPDYVNAQLVFFALLTVESYLRWTETLRSKWLGWLVISFGLGALTSWPIFYLVPLLSIHYLLSQPRRALARLLPFLVVATVLFFTLIFWADWAGGDDVSVFHKFSQRSIGDLRPDDGSFHITGRAWIERAIVRHQGLLHTWPVLALVSVYVAHTGARVRRRDLSVLRLHLAPLLLLAWGATHLLVGAQSNFQHAWWSVVVTPGLAFAAALGVEAILGALPNAVRSRAVANALVGAATVTFIAFSIRVSARFSEQWPHAQLLSYTLKELGSTIHSIAREDEGVLTSETLWEPALWFYSDRQIRPAITSPKELEEARAPGAYPLFYGYVQPHGPRPRWFVMPTSHRETFQPLARELDRRFLRRASNGFTVHQLY
jgi:4-amino-4-deoxy-L-arabinose transferase-like glycosyltransferase